METSDGEIVYEVVSGNSKDQEQLTDAEKKTINLGSALSDDPEAFVSIFQEIENRPSKYVTRISADKYDYGQLLEYLATEYGGGDYRIRLYANGKLRANKLESIAQRIATSNLPAKIDGANGIEHVLQSFLVNMGNMISQMTPPQQSRREMLDEMLLYKQLFGGAQQNDSLSQLTQSLEVLKTLGVEIGGKREENDSDSVMGFLGSIAEPLGEIVKGVAASQIPPQQNRGKTTLPQTQPNQPKKTGNIMNPAKLVFETTIKQHLNTLLKGAKNGTDAQIYADLILDQIPDKYWPKFLDFMHSPSWFKDLVRLNSGVGEFEGWFTLLREEIILAFSEDDDDHDHERQNDVSIKPNTKRASGDESDPESNEENS